MSKIFITSIFLVSFLTFSCSNSSKKNEQTYTRPVFAKQRLVVRKEYPGHLTNKMCMKYVDGKCQDWSLVKYDLNDPEVRKKLNQYKISCKVAQKRFRVCLDRPGFCRREIKCIKWKKSWWSKKLKCKKKDNVEVYLEAVKQHQILFDAPTVCYHLFI